jgi:tetratricopeptide (TPR) repeat protein
VTQALQPTINSLVSQGLHFHQQGDLVQAQLVYMEILTREPTQADALHLLGLVKGRMGCNAEAIRLIEQAIAVNPRVSAYHNNLGNLRAKIGDKPAAEQSYRRAIEADPRNADAYLNLGKLLDGRLLHTQAKDNFLASLRINPSSVETHMSLGRLQELTDDSYAALESYGNAIRLDPKFTPGYLAIGNLHKRLEKLDAAEVSYRTALAIDPSNADGYFNLAKLAASQGKLNEAVALYQKTIQLDPDSAADAYNNLGSVLSELNRHDDAVAAYRKAIELRPDYDDVFFNLGKELTTFGDEACGIAKLKQAIALNPANASAWLQLGVTALNSGFLGDAVRYFRQSLEVDSSSRIARRNLATALSYQGNPEGLRMLEALVREQPLHAKDHGTWGEHLLLHGRYAQGWEEYEWRIQVEELRSQHRHFEKPRWLGEPLDGKTILLYAEQGHGDTIQFSRFAKLAAERGGKVILEVQRSLKRLLQELPGVSQCIAQGECVPEFSVYAPLMSLPYILQARPETVPPLMLRPPAKSTIPDGHGTPHLRVGIAWAGSPDNARDRRRSTRLSQWAELASIEGVDFIALQVGEAAAQAAEPSNRLRFVAACSTATDFADTAAWIAQLDLVITVDTAIAHLAGSMGKPVWILLYNFGDWRWGLEGTQTAWYPTARLFRQLDPPDWTIVFSDVASSLRRRLAGD